MAQIESLLPIQPFDPLFKLFGTTISVGSCLSDNRLDGCAKDASVEYKNASDDANCTISEASKQITVAEENGKAVCMPEEVGSCSSSNNVSDNETPEQRRNYESDLPGAQSIGNDTSGLKKQHDDNVLPASNKANQKSNKLLPCPRCSSLNTKFCYFNNYNLKQPRHFCKQCQRYWTAGGNLRNLPVGAGRRKSKYTGSSHLASNDAVPVKADSSQQLFSAKGFCTGVFKVAHSALERISGLTSPSGDPSSVATLRIGGKKHVCDRLVAAATNMHRPGQPQNQGSQVLDLQNKCSAITEICSRVKNEIDTKEAIQETPQVKQEYDVAYMTAARSVDRPALSYSHPTRYTKSGADITESKVDPGNSFCKPAPLQTIPSWTNGLHFIFISGAGHYGCNVNQNMSLAASQYLPSTSGAKLMQDPGNLLLLDGSPAGMWLSPSLPVLQSPLQNLVKNSSRRTAASGRTAAAIALTEAPSIRPSLGQRSILGKHPRESLCLESKREGLLLAPKALKLDHLNIATRKSIWAALGLENKPDSLKHEP